MPDSQCLNSLRKEERDSLCCLQSCQFLIKNVTLWWTMSCQVIELHSAGRCLVPWLKGVTCCQHQWWKYSWTLFNWNYFPHHQKWGNVSICCEEEKYLHQIFTHNRCCISPDVECDVTVFTRPVLTSNCQLWQMDSSQTMLTEMLQLLQKLFLLISVAWKKYIFWKIYFPNPYPLQFPVRIEMSGKFPKLLVRILPVGSS
jgi:hypothetical protein